MRELDFRDAEARDCEKSREREDVEKAAGWRGEPMGLRMGVDWKERLESPSWESREGLCTK